MSDDVVVNARVTDDEILASGERAAERFFAEVRASQQQRLEERAKNQAEGQVLAVTSKRAARVERRCTRSSTSSAAEAGQPQLPAERELSTEPGSDEQGPVGHRGGSNLAGNF